jgi:hypothetical protein
MSTPLQKANIACIYMLDAQVKYVFMQLTYLALKTFSVLIHLLLCIFQLSWRDFRLFYDAVLTADVIYLQNKYYSII